MAPIRVEHDNPGAVNVPFGRLWGAQTQRSLERFGIGDDLIPREMIPTYAIVKKTAALVNRRAGRFGDARRDLIVRVCDKVGAGEEFPLHVWMTGSGTQFNMTINEMIANRCSQIAGQPLGGHRPVPPNDHVNISPSSNARSERSARMRVGLIGAGHMGSAMAERLLQAGHQLTVYNRTPSRAKPLIDRGARRAPRVADACQGDAVITMLADDAAVENVVFGDSGVIRAMRKGAIHISMSTISVALSERLADEHAAAGRPFLAAPVFGRPDAAAQGKLFIVAAGKPDLIDACTPLFDAIGQKTSRIGDTPPQANLVKLSGNFLIASIQEGLGEAIALVRKSGIDPQRYVDLLTSTVFSGPLFKTYGGLIARQEFEPAEFAATLGEKDLRLTLAAAEELRVPMPLASLVHDRQQTLIARGGEHLDWSGIGGLAAQDAGLG